LKLDLYQDRDRDAEPGAADYDFALRAERSGSAPGRTYAVTYLDADPSGNGATALVLVPHSRDSF
jgi:hypothetical protein